MLTSSSVPYRLKPTLNQSTSKKCPIPGQLHHQMCQATNHGSPSPLDFEISFFFCQTFLNCIPLYLSIQVIRNGKHQRPVRKSLSNICSGFNAVECRKAQFGLQELQNKQIERILQHNEVFIVFLTISCLKEIT